MSNARKLKPPVNVTAAAKAYRCSDCRSEPGRPWPDRDGIWHVPVLHGDGCPVLAGTISPLGDTLRCAAASGHVLIVTTGNPS